jgi:hypothetical protein
MLCTGFSSSESRICHADDVEADRLALVETRRAEALALLRINQKGRLVGVALIVAAFAAIAVTVVVSIALSSDDPAIPLPSFVLILLSLAFQQYGEVTVLGEARRRIERTLATELGEYGLIYETAVTQVRQLPPLVASVRLLQAVGTMVVVIVIAVGTVVALDRQPAIVELGFVGVTAACLVSAIMSYRDMLRAAAVAKDRLEASLRD